MRTHVRTYLALALGLLVVMTGQSMAASRGMETAVGQMVICTGTGPVVVMVDENGQPTQAPAYCPDYALALLGAVLPEDVTVIPRGPLGLPNPARFGGALISSVLLPPSARAPPVAV